MSWVDPTAAFPGLYPRLPIEGNDEMVCFLEQVVRRRCHVDSRLAVGLQARRSQLWQRREPRTMTVLRLPSSAMGGDVG